MARAYIVSDTLDDLMRSVIEETINYGEWIKVTKGDAIEITGIFLELSNPRARVSRTETRGKPYSCLGELCWYLAKSKALEFIEYYLPAYKQYADGDEIYGGYGPRLFGLRGIDQVDGVLKTLTKKRSSRQAVIQLFDAQDILEPHKDIPCTCTLQFMVRNDKLSLITNMRSNDIFIGMPHDFFCFTMLQEIMARSLGVELGTYKHIVGSLHLYRETLEAAKRFLAEGWQPKKVIMPPMPLGDPWPGIDLLLKGEKAVRENDDVDHFMITNIHPYWADLIRLLQVYRSKQKREPEKIKAIRNTMSSDAYLQFIDRALSRLS